MNIAILLADDHPAVRKALRLLLESAANLVVVGEADLLTLAEAIESVAKGQHFSRPDPGIVH